MSRYTVICQKYYLKHTLLVVFHHSQHHLEKKLTKFLQSLLFWIKPHCRPEIALDKCRSLSDLLTKIWSLQFSNRAIQISWLFDYRDTWSYDYHDTNFGKSWQLYFRHKSSDLQLGTKFSMKDKNVMLAPFILNMGKKYQLLDPLHPLNYNRIRGSKKFPLS